ncbi:MAG: VOC family protein [Acidimicrobiales bacterium]
MSLKQLDHYNIRTSKPEETVAFYCDVLGCVDGFDRRPAISSPGTWLLVEDHPAVHVVFVEADSESSTGPIDHVAFRAAGFLDISARLDGMDVDYDVAEYPQFDLIQVYLTDPNGVRVELNIPGEIEVVAAARAES